ncbi:PBS lyase HEAT-like repeat protein [delta proteobacterium NaphS2]|nr:PBS lyase HEAT-like repeat protein [delta proteobacterium NaphS2]
MTETKLLRELSEEYGIIQRLYRDSDKYIFLHRTFQEYFTACYLKQAIENKEQSGIELATNHIWDFDWHETLCLLAGLLKDPVPLIKSIMFKKVEISGNVETGILRYDDIFHTLLILAGRCIAECERVPFEILDILFDVIYFLQMNQLPEYFRATIVSLCQNHPHTVRWICENNNPKITIEKSLLTEIDKKEAVSSMIQDLKHEDSYVRSRAIYGLGQTSNPRAVQALIQALKDDDPKLVTDAVRALGMLGGPEAIQALIEKLTDENPELVMAAARSLDWISARASFKVPKNAFRNEYLMLVMELIEVLGTNGIKEALKKGEEEIGKSIDNFLSLGILADPKAIQALIEKLTDENPELVMAAARSWDWASALESFEVPKKAFKSKNLTPMWELIEVLARPLLNKAIEIGIKEAQKNINNIVILARIGIQKAVSTLKVAKKDPLLLCEMESIVLSEMIRAPRSIPNLVLALKDEELINVIRCIVETGRFGTIEGVQMLIQNLKNKDPFIAMAAAGALGESGSREAFQALIQALEHEDPFIAMAAAGALGKIGGPEAVQALIQALEHENPHIGMNAVSALGEIGGPEAVQALIQALEHENPHIGMNAVSALGEIGGPEVVQALIKTAEGGFPYINAIIGELGRIGSSVAVPYLARSLVFADRWDSTYITIVEALGNIGSPEAIQILILMLEYEWVNCREMEIIQALLKNGDLSTFEKVIQASKIDVSDPLFLSLARKFMIRHRKERPPIYHNEIKLIRSQASGKKRYDETMGKILEAYVLDDESELGEVLSVDSHKS